MSVTFKTSNGHHNIILFKADPQSELLRFEVEVPNITLDTIDTGHEIKCRVNQVEGTESLGILEGTSRWDEFPEDLLDVYVQNTHWQHSDPTTAQGLIAYMRDPQILLQRPPHIEDATKYKLEIAYIQVSSTHGEPHGKLFGEIYNYSNEEQYRDDVPDTASEMTLTEDIAIQTLQAFRVSKDDTRPATPEEDIL